MATPKDHAGNGADDPAQSSKGDQEEPSAFKGFLRVFDFGHAADYALESIAIIAAIASGVALAMVNIVIGQFVSLLSDSHSTSGSQPDGFMAAVSKTALYFVYIGIVRFVCTYIYASLFTFVAHRLTRNIRHEYLRAAFSQEIGFFDKSSGSISMQATSNGKLIQSGIGEKLGNLVQASATFVAAFIIAFITQWKLTLIIIGMVPVLLIVVGGAAGLDAQIETDILKIHAQAASFAETTLAGVRTVHAFDLRKRVVSQYDSFLQNSFRLGMKKNKIYGVLFGGEYFIVHAAMGLAFWQGIAMVNRGEIPDLGGVFTVLFSVVIAASTVMTIAPQMVTFGRSATAAAELFTLIDRKSEIDPFDQSGERPGRLVGEVQLQNVSFSYSTRPDVTVLDNFSLRVPAGKVTALVGPSGSGKSTIIGLFERWYNPTAGTVRLDGKDIKDLNLKWLRTNVRLVQQEPVLFNGTVLENISNGLVGTPWETATPEEQRRRVEDAAKLAFAHDFITSLPQGYDTRIGERGGLLSGGQKQRIAIARSLISEPQVLLLDEATSALDPHAEGVVQEALNRASQNRTTIVIAHKLATIRNADHIVVMSSGRIAEQGRHDDLVAMNGIYHNLIQPGEFVAFVGPSGCGKSTMVSLLQRFYDPVSGTINVDSSPLNSISPSLYRKNISLVQQEPTLFPGTIRDNISQGVDTTTSGPLPDFQLEEACRSANVWDFIASLPEGLDTPCGTGGSQLSGGQRQRIAIARALIRKPAVILLDEATSALDTESERIVQGALKKAATTGNRITIAVAHRLSTIRDASRIFVFNGGIIAESGTHGELIERGGMYAKMCEAQRLGQDM
ncbi:multidrug/pheromone exporter [Colletotrichum higginsianum]|nr:multidrug/pheromone exporter [Colletotrichum higginsianum]